MLWTFFFACADPTASLRETLEAEGVQVLEIVVGEGSLSWIGRKGGAFCRGERGGSSRSLLFWSQTSSISTEICDTEGAMEDEYLCRRERDPSSCLEAAFRRYKREEPAALGGFVEACGLGSAVACRDVGIIKLEGQLGLEADPVASLPWFERGCELGDGQGCRLRGEQLAKESPPGCETAARAWFEKGTSAGDAMSFNEIGFLEDHCPNGDKAAARRAFGAACEGGEPIGCRNQAMLLDKGAGGPADPKAAADLHERACRATERIADSCVDAGFFRYAHDAEAVALELFRLGCDSGAAVGCRNAAVVLRDSRTAKDPKGAREMFERACSGGDAPSCREIGAPMPGR